MQPLPISTHTWKDVTIDFVEMLLLSNRCDGVLVVIDHLTIYAYFIAIVYPYTAKTIIKLYVDYIMKLHSMLRSIVTDRDRVFMNNFWREYFKMHEMELTRSSTYHHQTNGQMEMTNRTLD